MPGGSDVGDTLKDKARDVAEHARQTKDRIVGQAHEIAGEVKQQAKTILDQQKDMAADAMDGVADVLRQTAQQLPTPVPSVMTISTPFPEIAPNPCTSASFATRTGFFKRACNTSTMLKPCHSWAKFGACLTIPSTITPGKPTANRSKGLNCFESDTTTFMTSSGFPDVGVSRRSRSPITSPKSLTNVALMPLPPTSTTKVLGRSFSVGLLGPLHRPARRPVLPAGANLVPVQIAVLLQRPWLAGAEA